MITNEVIIFEEINDSQGLCGPVIGTEPEN